MGFPSRSGTARNTTSLATGTFSWTIFKSIGRQMKIAPTLISFVKVSVKMAQRAAVIPAGGESRNFVRGQRLCFILMYRISCQIDPCRNPPRYLRCRTDSRVLFWPFDGWEVSRGKSVVAEVYPLFGVTPSAAMLGVSISMTLTRPRNGCAEVILMAAWIDFSAQTWRCMKKLRPKSRAVAPFSR